MQHKVFFFSFLFSQLLTFANFSHHIRADPSDAFACNTTILYDLIIHHEPPCSAGAVDFDAMANFVPKVIEKTPVRAS